MQIVKIKCQWLFRCKVVKFDNSALPNSATSHMRVVKFDNVVEFCDFLNWYMSVSCATG